MGLIIISLITGFFGLLIGGAFGEMFAFLFGLIGVLGPALYTLQQMNERLENLEKKKSSLSYLLNM